MKIYFHQTLLSYPAHEAAVQEVSAALGQAAVHIFPAFFLWGLNPGELARDHDAQQSYHALAKRLIDLAKQAPASGPDDAPALIIAPGVRPNGGVEFLCLTRGQGGRWVDHTTALSELLAQVLGNTVACAYGDEPFTREAAIYLRWPTTPPSLLRPKLSAASFNGAYFSLVPVGWSYAQCWMGGSEGHCQKPVQLPFLQPAEIVLETHAASPAPFPASWQKQDEFLRWDSSTPPQLLPLTDEEMTLIEDTIIFALRSYAEKNQRPSFLLGLSGGLDSAYVLAILAQAIKAQHLEALYMPSSYSAALSCQIAEEIAQKLGVKLWHVPIKFPHKVLAQHFGQIFGNWHGLPDENLQARLRMLSLYARANQTGAHVLNTSNKSEIAMGFSTLYGDSVGAYSILGDLFKTQIIQLANHYNQRFGKIIPPAVITRPPSAELKENQKDEDRLPPYAQLDAILEGLLSAQKSPQDLKQAGFNPNTVDQVVAQWKRSAFKRWGSMPILNLTSSLQGIGRGRPLEG